MSSGHEISLNQNGLNQHHQQQLMFRVQGDALRFGGPPLPPQTTQPRRVEPPKPAPPNFADRYFAPSADFRRNLAPPHSWNSNSGSDESEGDESEEEEDDDVDDDDIDDDAIRSSNVNINAVSNNNANNSNSGKIVSENGKEKLHSAFVKDGNLAQGSGVSESHGRMVSNNLNYGSNAAVVTVAEQPADGDMYYTQYLQGAVAVAGAVEGSNGGCGDSGQKDLVAENGCGFSGRKDGSSFSTESGESLRAVLSDPITGALMDDARILPCGHSFGGGGIQHVIRMKACYTCSQPVSEDLIAPNLSLRIAVQAFRREDDSQFYRPSKRRRERFDQEKGSYGDPTATDPPRGRGVQFPFVVTDRVIIKGNKRTPQRFVGCEAVVTAQCLNGWYVVKTLDNAESVKLQYRSLAKVPDDPTKPMPSKMAASWLQ